MYKKMFDTEEFIQYVDKFENLYNSCFSCKTDKDKLLWRYINNPCKGIYVNVAIENKKIISNYAVSPILLDVEGRKVKAALSLNTMTHRDYRGKGLFVELANELYEKLENDGFEIVIGFPHYTSNRGFMEKLDWNCVYEIPTLELDLKNRANTTKKVDSINIANVINKYKSNNSKVSIYKNEEVLKWRYLKNREFKYESIQYENSYLIFKEYKDILNLVDYSISKNEDFDKLIKGLIDLAMYRKKNKITTWFSCYDKKHLYLEKYGFCNKEPITYFGVKILNNFIGDENYILNYKNWDIKMGDDNIY